MDKKVFVKNPRAPLKSSSKAKSRFDFFLFHMLSSLLEMLFSPVFWLISKSESGKDIRVSIRDVFSGKAKLVAIRGESPAQNYAVFRLLLAIFWRAHTPESKVAAGSTFSFGRWFERTWRKLDSEGRDQVVLDYLAGVEDRFDLLHPETPFMQVADLESTSGERKPVTMLIPEVPEQEKEFFSMRAGSGRDFLGLDEAARWLIYLQAFDFSGIKTGAVGDSRVKGGRGYPIGTGWSGMTGGTLVKGPTLLLSFLLNTTIDCITTPADHPVWERLPDSAAERATRTASKEWPQPTGMPQGPADLATWQARRVRIFVDGPHAVEVIIAQGDKIPDAGANVMNDPMTPYRFSTNKSKKGKDVYYPRQYDSERTVWRSLVALVVAAGDTPADEKDKGPIRPATLTSLSELAENDVDGVGELLPLELVSIEYGPQASSVASSVSARVDLPVALLGEDSEEARIIVLAAANATLDAGIELGRFAKNLQIAAGGSSRDIPFPAGVTDSVMAELAPLFNEWLRSLEPAALSASAIQTALRNSLAQWEGTARDKIDQHARDLLRGAGPRALVGRVDKESGQRILSAGNYYRGFSRKMNEYFPSTKPLKKDEKPALDHNETGKEENN